MDKLDILGEVFYEDVFTEKEEDRIRELIDERIASEKAYTQAVIMRGADKEFDG